MVNLEEPSDERRAEGRHPCARPFRDLLFYGGRYACLGRFFYVEDDAFSNGSDKSISRDPREFSLLFPV